MEIRVKRMLYSTKERIHVRGITCTFGNIKTMWKTEETKTTKEVKATTIKNLKENQQNQNNTTL